MTGSLFGFHVWVNLGSDPLNHERNLEAGVREEGEREDEHGKGLRNVLEHRRLRRFHMSLNPYRVTLSFKCSCIQFRICPISETGEHGCACTSRVIPVLGGPACVRALCWKAAKQQQSSQET